MDDLFLIINEAGIIECASPRVAEAFGYTLTELAGQPWSRVLVVPGRKGDPTKKEFWSGASQSPLLQGIHRDGRCFPLRLTEHEVHGAGQTHNILILHDPDVAPTSEGIFTKHRDLFQMATMQGRIAVWEADYRTNHYEYSPVLVEMLKLSEEQIPKTVGGWKNYFHPDDWAAIENQTEQMLRKERLDISVECRLYPTDGTTLWALVRGQATFDDQGRPLKSIGTTIDITDRKNAQVERDLFFTLSLDLLCIANLESYFLRVNPTFCQTLGYTESELTSTKFLTFVHPEDLERTQDAMRKLAQGTNVVAFENRYRCKDGSWRWLSWTCPAPQPKSQTLFAIARDVTDAKRVAAELEQAVREAERANRAKSEFLSRMSHELRTPLNAILGFGQLLQRESLTSRQHQQVDMIVNGGRHLLNLINEVLDITRIEAGRMALSPEAVALTELIEETVGLAQPIAEQRAIQITLDRASLTEQRVQADKQRLKQVLLNLISNAIKYNVDQGSVRVFGEPVSPNRFRIHVRDAGIGIPAEKQARLFTPFDRLGAETTSIEGSGLGLVLSKRLTEIMGGTLTFASQAGQGSTFTIELAQACRPGSTRPVNTGMSTGPTLSGPTRTLLYIEDNLTNVQLIEAVLAYRPGIQVLTAMQGSIGLELARRHHPDLILLDVHLPDMLGSDLIATLRADPALREIPVVIISADATSHQIACLLAGGARDYLTKPIDVELFLQVVDRHLLKQTSDR